MGGRLGWDVALAALLLSFVTSMVIAVVYTLTYQGIGYLRSFVHTIAMGGLVAALVMLAIGDDIARGLGMVGALTLVRFRTTLKDTRDLIFVFVSLAAGVACGVQAFAVALLGTAIFVAAAIFLTWSNFGTRRQFDLVLRFALSKSGRDEAVQAVLDRHCRSCFLIDARASGGASHEYAYHLKLARPGTETLLMRELEAVPGVQEAAVFTHDSSLEL